MRAGSQLFLNKCRFISADFFGFGRGAVVSGGDVAQKDFFRFSVKHNVMDIEEQIAAVVGGDQIEAEQAVFLDIKGLDQIVFQLVDRGAAYFSDLAFGKDSFCSALAYLAVFVDEEFRHQIRVRVDRRHDRRL